MNGERFLELCKEFIAQNLSDDEILRQLTIEEEKEIAEKYRLRLEKNNEDGDVGV